MAEQRNVVGVWKNVWLPRSETFIRDQLASMRNWDACRIGFSSISDGIPIVPDYAPYGSDSLSKLVRLGVGVRPYKRSYVKLLGERGVSVLHAHFGSGGVNALPLARDSNLPLITTFHGNDASTYGSSIPFLNKRYMRGLRELFSAGTLMLPVSEYVAGRLLRTGAPSSKIRVHYTGTPIPRLPAHELERSGVLFVGRLVAKKGVSDLLAALGSLPPSLRGVPVTIVGDGPERLGLERLADELGLRARFTGWLDPSEVSELMWTHSVFCAPSHRTATEDAEGFGMVYVEAALRQLPVVAYDIGGSREAVKHAETGLLVPERDIAALSRSIAELLGSGGAQLGRAGRERAEANFDIVKQTRQLETIYADTARG